MTCMDSKVDDNGNYLVLTGSEDCTLKLSTVHANATDVGAGGSKVLGNFFAHEKCIECVEFCDGTVGNYAASGSVDATIRVTGFADAKSARRALTRESRESVEMGAKLSDVIQVRAFSFLKSSFARCRLFLLLLLNLSRFFLFATKGPSATS